MSPAVVIASARRVLGTASRAYAGMPRRGHIIVRTSGPGGGALNVYEEHHVSRAAEPHLARARSFRNELVKRKYATPAPEVLTAAGTRPVVYGTDVTVAHDPGRIPASLRPAGWLRLPGIVTDAPCRFAPPIGPETAAGSPIGTPRAESQPQPCRCWTDNPWPTAFGRQRGSRPSPTARRGSLHADSSFLEATTMEGGV